MYYNMEGIDYEVVIIKKRNKNTYVRVKEDMKIYVTTNYLTTKGYIKKLLDENYNYLCKMIDRMCKRNEKSDLFFYLGNSYDIIFLNDLKKVDVDSENFVIYTKDLKQLNRWYNKVIKNTFIERFTYIYNLFDDV